ncbi:hypothetical protein L2Z53_02410 [Macrococcoides canis]|uniref:hypothetical protein n=1 Tax=Macrococcoides canis TaxID=1855823 RepID=UPI001F397021|nr:hypothetical protein [Macrococcus canis]UJS28220.1 hypothetical protein L2Z53_02410 [Macrococcus canis]
MESKLHEFWKGYTCFPENTLYHIEHYSAFHPEDLLYIRTHYPHFFEPITRLKGRKLAERIKFEQHMKQLNGQYIYCEKEGAIRDDNHINIWVPEPFSGNLDEVKLLILLVNPHFTPQFHQDDKYKLRYFQNLHKERCNFAPHEFEDSAVDHNNKLNWFYQNFYKYIEDSGITFKQNDLMNIEFLPYASANREDTSYLNQLLPSQLVAIEEVRNGMLKGIPIIVRSTEHSRWFQHIPELLAYESLYIFTNYKKPTLHPHEVMRYSTYKERHLLASMNHLRIRQQEDYSSLLDYFK